MITRLVVWNLIYAIGEGSCCRVLDQRMRIRLLDTRKSERNEDSDENADKDGVKRVSREIVKCQVSLPI